jgi:hypothetical protein
LAAAAKISAERQWRSWAFVEKEVRHGDGRVSVSEPPHSVAGGRQADRPEAAPKSTSDPRMRRQEGPVERCPADAVVHDVHAFAVGELADLVGEILVAQHVIGSGFPGKFLLGIRGHRGDDPGSPGLQQLGQQQANATGARVCSTVWPGSTLKEELIR